MRILKALLIKEFIMLRRDAFLLRTIILLPLVVMLVLPLVANMDVKNAGIAVVDNDMSQLLNISRCRSLHLPMARRWRPSRMVAPMP